MPYPLKKASSKKKSDKVKLRPGDYKSEVKEVVQASGYQEGDAYTLVYALTDAATGKIFEKKETFLNSMYRDRTREFVEYLEENGVELNDFEELVGLCENVKLEKVLSDYGNEFLNIVSREFVGFNIESGE